ncbi:MAG TPA: ATP-binding protein [Chitinophagaceae bacterium]|nr:ATP-binding protein [Chitinophagaceae bacterium]
MNICRSFKKLYCLILFLLFLVYQSQPAAAQTTLLAQQNFHKLNDAYRTGNVSAKEYLSNAIKLTSRCWENGVHFKTQELTDLLSLYKELAWSKKEHGAARLDYYNAFINNAHVLGQTGAAMYYADKRSQVSKQNGDPFSLTTDYLKIQIFAEQELYNKVIAIYEADRAYIEALPQQLISGKTEFVEGMNAVSMSSEVIDAYIQTKDTAAVYQTARLAEQISAALKQIYPLSRQSMLGNDFYTILRRYQIALFEGRKSDAGMLLDSMQAVKNGYKDQEAAYVDLTLFQSKIDYFLSQKNQDSVQLYIMKFESLPVLIQNQKAVIDEYKANLYALRGDFYGSSNFLTAALSGERKAKTALMTEMNNLLYAYTEAENSKIELQQSEKVKQQRTLWLVIISIFSTLIVMAIYLTMGYRNRKARSQIKALNAAANMQIIAMEEAKHQAVRAEQQRLGQDLHDGLSSTIAAIRYQLEELAIDTEDIALKKRLNKLQTETASVYEAVRGKSHDWYATADEKQEFVFEQQISLLVDSALPENRYTKTIHIDDHSMINVDTDIRITLLRIIQEGVTNIIKHAKAKNVNILIYRETDKLVLTVSDDGVGMAEQNDKGKQSTMGLESIRRRVGYMNGETKIVSDTKGTEITITIPVAPPKTY